MYDGAAGSCKAPAAPLAASGVAPDSCAFTHYLQFGAAEGRDPDAYFEGLLRDWSGDKSLKAFAPAALHLYRQAWGVPERIHAFCEDYRAGATRDRDADLADLAAGRRLACPTLILTGDSYLDREPETPLAAWQRTFAPGAVAAVPLEDPGDGPLGPGELVVADDDLLEEGAAGGDLREGVADAAGADQEDSHAATVATESLVFQGVDRGNREVERISTTESVTPAPCPPRSRGGG